MKQTTLEDVQSSLLDQVRMIAEEADKFSLEEKVDFLNEARRILHEDLSPFKNQPVDFVKWVPAETVKPNNYNPNHVASHEMKMLTHSIRKDGVTQPIVSAFNPGDNINEVVDGEHRNEVERDTPDIREELHGYLPITELKNKTRAERQAAMWRHNKARGRHGVIGNSELVKDQLNQGVSETEITEEFGMSPEELLRLEQQAGVAKVLANSHYARAWVVSDNNLDGSTTN